MPEHSPEPWEVGEEHESEADILDAEGHVIGTIRQHFGIKLPGESNAKGDADVRRVIACVNALAGIPDEALPAVQKFFNSILGMPVRIRPRQLPDVEMANILEAFLNATKNESH